VTCTVLLSPVVKYRGLGSRLWLLVRPQLTAARWADENGTAVNRVCGPRGRFAWHSGSSCATLMQMHRWWLGVVGIAAFVLNGTACGIGHSCTDIGCGSGVSVTLTPQSGTWQEGQYTLDLTMDGRKQECTLRIPNDSPTGHVSCGGGVRMEFTSNVDDFVLRVLVDSAPKSLGLSLSRDGTVILAESPTLTYQESHPNGADCGVCRSTSVDVTVVD
jgi:hypothetical protein